MTQTNSHTGPVDGPAALAYLKAGRTKDDPADRIAYRKGWNGKGMYLYLAGKTRFVSPEIREKSPFYWLEDTFVLFTAQDTHVAWSATHTDLLAEDWYLTHACNVADGHPKGSIVQDEE